MQSYLILNNNEKDYGLYTKTEDEVVINPTKTVPQKNKSI